MFRRNGNSTGDDKSHSMTKNIFKKLYRSFRRRFVHITTVYRQLMQSYKHRLPKILGTILNLMMFIYSLYLNFTCFQSVIKPNVLLVIISIVLALICSYCIVSKDICNITMKNLGSTISKLNAQNVTLTSKYEEQVSNINSMMLQCRNHYDVELKIKGDMFNNQTKNIQDKVDSQIKLMQDKLVSHTQTVGEAWHNMFHVYRDDIIPMCKDDFDQPRQFAFYLNHLSRLFSDITEAECAACIKIINGDNSIVCLCRDDISMVSRVDRDMSETISLQHILYDIHTKTLEIWACNNIARLYRVGNQQRWKDFYASTLVSSITYSREHKIYGYLCIDSKKKYVFNRSHHQIIMGVADMLAPLIHSYSANIINKRVEYDEIQNK